MWEGWLRGRRSSGGVLSSHASRTHVTPVRSFPLFLPRIESTRSVDETRSIHNRRGPVAFPPLESSDPSRKKRALTRRGTNAIARARGPRLSILSRALVHSHSSVAETRVRPYKTSARGVSGSPRRPETAAAERAKECSVASHFSRLSRACRKKRYFYACARTVSTKDPSLPSGPPLPSTRCSPVAILL